MTPGRLYALCLTPATLIRTAYGYAPGNFFGNGGRGRGMNVNVVYGLGVENGLRVRGGPDWVRSAVLHDRSGRGRPGGRRDDARTDAARAARAALRPEGAHRNRADSRAGPDDRARRAQDEGRNLHGPRRGGGAAAGAGRRRSPPWTWCGRNLDAARRGATTVSPCGYYGAANGPNLIFVGAGAGLPGVGGPGGRPSSTGPAFRTRLASTTSSSTCQTTHRESRSGPGCISGDSSSVPPAPPLEIALEQQLGLRLEPAQAPREFIVIDAIERPAPN